MDNFFISVKTSNLTQLPVFFRLFIYLFRAVIGLHCRPGFLQLQGAGPTPQLRCTGGPCCRVWAQQLLPVGSVALQHTESPQTRDGALGPCIGRWIPKYWTTQEVPGFLYFFLLNPVTILRGKLCFQILLPNKIQSI